MDSVIQPSNNWTHEMKEATGGDTIQEEDSKQAAEEGSTQENVLNQKKKKTDISCVK